MQQTMSRPAARAGSQDNPSLEEPAFAALGENRTLQFVKTAHCGGGGSICWPLNPHHPIAGRHPQLGGRGRLLGLRWPCPARTWLHILFLFSDFVSRLCCSVLPLAGVSQRSGRLYFLLSFPPPDNWLFEWNAAKLFVSPNPLIFDSKLLKYSFYANSYCACESQCFPLFTPASFKPQVYIFTSSIMLTEFANLKQQNTCCCILVTQHLRLEEAFFLFFYANVAEAVFFPPLASSTCLTCLG